MVAIGKYCQNIDDYSREEFPRIVLVLAMTLPSVNHLTCPLPATNSEIESQVNQTYSPVQSHAFESIDVIISKHYLNVSISHNPKLQALRKSQLGIY